MRFATSIKNAGILAAAIVAVSTGAAQAVNKDSVYDQRSAYVIDQRGNCVRTRWDTASDPCAKEVAVAEQRTVADLNKEELVVYFDFDRAALTPTETQKLDRLAEILKASSEVSGATITGFADPIGSVAYNNNLSAKRANAVKSYLDSKGYNRTSTDTVQAAGETDVYARCEGVKGRQALIDCFWKNRRVEITVNRK